MLVDVTISSIVLLVKGAGAKRVVLDTIVWK